MGLFRNVVHKRVCFFAIFIFVIVYTFSLNFEYPFQYRNLFEDELALDIITRRKLHLNTYGKLERINKDKPACDVYNVTRPYTAAFNCIETKTSPSVTICLYDEWSDMYISHDLKHTGIWEPQVLADFQRILHRNPGIGVIDLGANIGYYTMIAAKMGHPVVAVEPYFDSIYRLHRSLQIERLFDHVVVVHNAVAEERRLASLINSGDNQGDTRVHMDYKPCIGSCPIPVNTIILDDLLEVITFNTTVLKMDIQGFECAALKHSSKMLSTLTVPYIFMEWGLMGQHYYAANHTSAEKYRIQEMIRMLFDKSYRPYSLTSDGGKPLNALMWHSWPFDIIWIKRLGKSEYEKFIRNHFLNWP